MIKMQAMQSNKILKAAIGPVVVWEHERGTE